MRRLGREILVPTLVLTGVVLAALGFLGFDAAREARELERDANQVRRATALALALADAAQEEERRMTSLAAGAGAADEELLSEARDHVDRLAASVDAAALPPRAADVWRRFLESRRTIRPVAERFLAAARWGDRAATARVLDQWRLVNDRADRLLRSFTAYHLNRLDRTVAELQRRRARALGGAGLAIAGGLLLAVGFAWALARTVVRPIVEMASAAKRIQATGAAVAVAGAERTDELGVLARAFNDMTERLVSANATLAGANASLAEAVRARDEFISIASHELKTPLTPLVLRIQQLLRVACDPAAHPTREQVVGAARNLESHVLKLARLVENLLDVSRINSGKLALRLEEFPVAGAIGDALDRVSAELQAAGCAVRVEAPGDLTARGDRLRVEQVLVNLLGNAAKYAPGAPVVVRAADDGAGVRIEVEDSGPGVGAGDHERIFQRFERASADGQVAGLGLGLYIAREIVHAHGGELAVRSSPGQGATFTVRLPPAAPLAASAPAAAGSPRSR